MSRSCIIGIVLAAGKSSRMKKNKLSLPLEDTTIGSRAVQSALESRLDHVLLVTKEKDALAWLSTSLFDKSTHRRWSQVQCADADRGQAYSLRCGVQAAINRQATAIVVILADQPLIKAEMINDLIDRFQIASIQGEAIEFTASTYKGRIQPPILFSSNLFSMLMQLKGDKGARTVLRRKSPSDGITVEYDDRSCFYDIDTEDDYKWLKEMNKL
ncbi:nucleotidyltransferase family protein [Halobacillus seohaensis]|uniref:NTP transferase domain-containing protein n=1 Tax=Halobacillus seohaensis TaxID=447421 RepID=A0ABW2ETJ9_9BACI